MPQPAHLLHRPTRYAALVVLRRSTTWVRNFHEGTRWGLLGELGELFVNRESFDIYVCPRCGRVEFFVDGVGEEFRSPHPTGRGLPTAEEAFARYQDGVQREAKGDAPGALSIYEQVVAKFPGTDAAHDAARSIESLRRRTK
jgi:hypothetical protein